MASKNFDENDLGHDVRKCACWQCNLHRFWHDNPGVIAPSFQQKIDTMFAVQPVNSTLEAYSRADADSLQVQFESLLDTVWKSEADWRFNDRLDMAVRRS